MKKAAAIIAGALLAVLIGSAPASAQDGWDARQPGWDAVATR